jgi:hypothetical protein
MDVRCSDETLREHPVIILTQTAEIPTEPEWVGVVCSHSGARKSPRPLEYIEIPHHPKGVGPTKLSKETVAICTWLTTIPRTSPPCFRVTEGVVPRAVMELIVTTIIEIHGGIIEGSNDPT